MRKQNITLKELSAELSLSPATISLALSGKGDTNRIARVTRRRIGEAADRLGYRPNHMARSMRRGKTDTIGVVFPDVSDAYMNHIPAGIETVALEQVVSVVIATGALNSSVEIRNLDALMDRSSLGLHRPLSAWNHNPYDDWCRQGRGPRGHRKTYHYRLGEALSFTWDSLNAKLYFIVETPLQMKLQLS